jgi:aminoglycoside phosphotransferase family enzyme/predicted kinase
MTRDPQAEVISFLSDPGSHMEDEPVEVIDTHAAHVFLTGGEALKIKRSVRYDYLDYSTLAKRRAALERELELNTPAAPGIYRDVVAITREADGALAFAGQGRPVEWVLRMTRFPTENELAHVAARGALDLPLAEALGRSVARYHGMAEIRADKPSSILIAQILDELAREFSGMEDAVSGDDIRAFLTGARQILHRETALLDARTKAGRVRRCHGDLHLRNIVLLDGIPTPFDALEFDEELGTCDVLYDLAFLLMDLRHRGLDMAANAVMNAWLRVSETETDLAGLSVLPLFISLRAAISAMVAVQTARARGGDAAVLDDARRYLADACTARVPVAPRLIAIGGLSGTGKTTLARTLSPGIGPVPGAVHLRSDTERKAMLGVGEDTHLPDTAYTAKVNAQVYDRIARRAHIALSAGHAVIADAVFLRAEERDAIEEVARDRGVRFAGLWLDAGPETLVSRVEARRGDASDADAAVVRMQLDRLPDHIGWRHVDASGTPDEAKDRALAALGASDPE